MNKDLNSYIKKYKMLDEEQCDIILKDLTSRNFEIHRFADYNDVFSEEVSQPLNYNVPIKPENHKLIIDSYRNCLSKYITDIDKPWFSSWGGYSTPKYIRYSEKNEMRIHCDHIYSIFENNGSPRGVPILTMILLLSDEFEGGSIEMFDNEETYNLKKGEVLIFPSNFLYPHKVTPITKGERNTAVSWVY